jgi:aspartate-semialdehyde dehydrogenase
MEDEGRDKENSRPKDQSHCNLCPRPAESLNIEFEDEISADEARALLRESPGLMVVDKADNDEPAYVTPVECVGEYATFVSRIREDSTQDNTLNLWCVSDNLRKGAALNTVQIAELLGNRKLPRNAQSAA